MKKKFAASLLIVGALSFGALLGCNQNNNPSTNPSTPGDSGSSAPAPSGSGGGGGGDSSSQAPAQFNFSVSLQSGGTTINKGEVDSIKITESNNDGTVRQYSFSSSNNDVATVDAEGVILAVNKGNVRFTVTESTAGLRRVLDVEITEAVLASGGYNYASLAGEEAVNTRTEILGKLEKYAIDNHLTGITLFENGGYVKYH